MLTIIALLLFAAIGGIVLTLAAVGNLVIRLDGLAAQVAADAEEDTIQSKITRSYLVQVIENRLFKHLGIREPAPDPATVWMKDVWSREVEGIEPETKAVDCGTC
jgi:hypothetical protein